MTTALELDIADELERKTIETLDRLQRRYADGLISPDAYVHSLRTVNEVTRGLVDSEIGYSIDETCAELPQVPIRHIFVYPDANPKKIKLMLLSYTMGAESYFLIDLTDGIRRKEVKNDALNKSAEAYHQFKKIRERMKTTGFKELS